MVNVILLFSGLFWRIYVGMTRSEFGSWSAGYPDSEIIWGMLTDHWTIFLSILKNLRRDDKVWVWSWIWMMLRFWVYLINVQCWFAIFCSILKNLSRDASSEFGPWSERYPDSRIILGVFDDHWRIFFSILKNLRRDDKVWVWAWIRIMSRF